MNLGLIRGADDDICFIAVKQDPLAIKYIKKQTLEICLAAVTQDGMALQYVKDKTPEICAAAIQKNPESSVFLPPGYNPSDVIE